MLEVGTQVPDIALLATDGRKVNLGRLRGLTVVYVYPRTGVPGAAPIEGWADIPGASGCTPQSCGFRDHHAELRRAGAAEVFGLSTQDTAYQQEAVERLGLPFAILSDAELHFATALGLETFEAGGMTLLKRGAFVVEDGVFIMVQREVSDPGANADEVLNWLRTDRVV
jgi:peroxiredoxin